MIEPVKAWAMFDEEGGVVDVGWHMGDMESAGGVPVVILREQDWQKVAAVVEAAQVQRLACCDEAPPPPNCWRRWVEATERLHTAVDEYNAALSALEVKHEEVKG